MLKIKGIYKRPFKLISVENLKKFISLNKKKCSTKSLKHSELILQNGIP
jgi:hypothetical protein